MMAHSARIFLLHQGNSLGGPTDTYRIQFRNGTTFDRAAGLVPYLKRLGISHVYASQVLFFR